MIAPGFDAVEAPRVLAVGLALGLRALRLRAAGDDEGARAAGFLCRQLVASAVATRPDLDDPDIRDLLDALGDEPA